MVGVNVSVLLFVWGVWGCLTCYCVLGCVCCVADVVYFINAACVVVWLLVDALFTFVCLFDIV